ncbi:MAG: hypothetical protein ACREKH_12970 [Candidatus Rokuibacteriota bacterium]
MWLKTLVFSIALLSAASAMAQGRALLTPLVVDGERYFTLQWQAVDTRVHGVIVNEFGFGARDVRLLIDSLDASGGVTAQTIAYVPFALPPGTRSYFEARIPARAASYRVTVFQWEWIQAGGGDTIL